MGTLQLSAQQGNLSGVTTRTQEIAKGNSSTCKGTSNLKGASLKRSERLQLCKEIIKWRGYTTLKHLGNQSYPLDSE